MFGSKTPRFYSPNEEIAHAVTHGVGAWLSTIGLTLLAVLSYQQGDGWRMASLILYGTTLLMAFLASTLYHSFSNPRVKHVLKIVDHCSIFLLIAGTYTPFTIIAFRGSTGWKLFSIVWSLTLLGILFKLFFVKRYRFLSTMVYLAMGWLITAYGQEIFTSLTTGGIAWLFAGGLFYTGGVIFYLWKKMPYHHAIWHLFVLAGSICHYFAILLFVLPNRP